MIGMGPFITEAGTPVADMWQQQFGHVDKKKVGWGLGGWGGWGGWDDCYGCVCGDV